MPYLYAHTDYSEPFGRWFARTHLNLPFKQKERYAYTPGVMVRSRSRGRPRKRVRARSGRSYSRGLRSQSLPATPSRSMVRGRSRVRSIPGTASMRSARSTSLSVYRPRRLANKNAKYGGKIGRVSKNSGRKFDSFNKRGVVYYEENQGTRSDTKAVYVIGGIIGHNNYLINVICAILKKLLGKAGIRCTGAEEVLELIGVGSGTAGTNSMLIQLYSLDQGTGTVSLTTSVDTGTSTTLLTIAANFIVSFQNWSSGYDNTSSAGDANNLVKPYAFILRVNALGVSTNLAEIRLDEVHVETMAKMSMRVQNRSLADSTENSADAENVSNQPLEGRVYYCSGIPRPKSSEQATAIQRRFALLTTETGVKAIAAATDVMTEMYHLPSPGFFSNCTRSAKLHIDPGELKHFSLYFYKSMGLESLMKKLRIQFSVTGTGYQSNYSMFPTFILGVEDMIQVDTSDTLSVAYSANRTVGVIVNEKKHQFYKTHLYENAIGNS